MDTTFDSDINSDDTSKTTSLGSGSSKLNWSDEEYSIGIRILDEQHKRLLDLINEVYFISENQGTAEDLAEMVSQVESYMRTHFIVEEEFMRLFHYPGYDHHRRAHVEFGALLDNLRAHASQPDQLSDFLTNWLTTHVLMSDQDMGRFLTSLGLR